jgi:restriction endonuclease
LCVNQQGERLRGFDINTLTVVANESYEDFADNLQKEIEADTGIQFGIVKDHDFAQIATVAPDGTAGLLGYEKSKELWAILKAVGHIDTRGKVQDSLRIAIRDETLVLPPEFMQYRPEVMAKLKKVAGKLDIKNADQRRSLSPRRAVLDGPDFKELWDRIKHRTTYRLHFDNEALIARSIEAVNESPPLVRTRLEWRKAGIAITFASIELGAESSAGQFAGAPVTTNMAAFATEDGGDPKEYERLGLTPLESPRLLVVCETYGDIPPLNSTVAFGPGAHYTVRSVKPYRPDGTALFSYVIISR